MSIMRKIIFAPVLLMAFYVSMPVMAEKVHTTDKTFRHSFHHARNVHRFDKENGTTEYDFMMKGRYVSAFYNEAGNLVETDYSIAYQELPARVTEFIQSEFSHPVITDIVRVEYKQNTCYKVRVEANGKEYRIASTASGELVIGYE